MPIKGINQPEIISIDGIIRLKAHDGNYLVAFPWYQDDVVRKFSEGITDSNIMLDENWVAKNSIL